MKVKYFIYLFAVVLVTIAVNLKDRRNQDLNLVANIEAFSAACDPEIDATLEPYYALQTYDYWIGEFGKSTKIPCCLKVNSQYSGCARGLDRCKK